jgi:hypothetical protein
VVTVVEAANVGAAFADTDVGGGVGIFAAQTFQKTFSDKQFFTLKLVLPSGKTVLALQRSFEHVDELHSGRLQLVVHGQSTR